MRVICIDGDFPLIQGYNHPNGDPIEGNIYTVVDNEIHIYMPIYELAEFPPSNNGKHWWGANQFAPVSDIEEGELSEEQCEEIRKRQLIKV